MGGGLDFRIGGIETGRFVLTEGPGAGDHRNLTHYLDIIEGERIVYAYTMALDGRIHSASLATVTFADENGGTRMSLTEQGSFFPPSDGVEGRRHGWEALIDALEGFLKRDAA